MALPNSNAVGLLFRIRADASQASKELKDFNKEVEKETTEAADAGQAGADKVAGSVTGMTTAITAAVAVAATLAVAAGAAGKALFDMAQSAAENTKELNNLIEATGLEADQLSALQFAAEASGKSFDTISESIGKFSELINDAIAGSKAANIALERFGIDPQQAIKDLDGALETVFRQILALEDPLERAKAAEIAFGDAGKDILPVIASFNGDISQAIKNADAFGAVMGEDAVRAGNEFNAEYAKVTAQLNALYRVIGTELLPVLTEMFSDLSTWLKNNKEEWKSWGENVATAIKAASLLLANFSSFAGGGVGDPAAVAKRYNELFGKQKGQSLDDINFQPVDIGEYINKGRTPDLSDIEGRRKAEEKAARDALAASKKRLAEAEAQLRDSLANLDAISRAGLEKLDLTLKNALRVIEEIFEQGTYSPEEFKDRSTIALNEWSKGVVQILNATAAGRIAAAQGNADKLTAIEADLDVKLLRLNESIAAKKKAIDDRAAKDAIAILKQSAKENADVINALSKMRDEKAKEDKAAVDAYLDSINNAIDALKTIRDLERERLDIARAVEDIRAAETESGLVAAVDGAYSESARAASVAALVAHLEKQAQVKRDRQIADAAEERDREKERAEQEIEDETLLQEALYQIDLLYKERKKLSQAEYEEAIKQIKLDANDGLSPIEQLIEDLERAGEAFATFGDITNQIGGLIASVMAGIAEGVANMTREYVLYGKLSGAAIRKAVAEQIAAFAAYAAKMAIFATALGFLRLAQWDFAGATQAFTSAAIWAGLAVGSALIGRAVAGDSFNRETSPSAGASSGASSGSSASGGDNTQVVDINRNTPSRSGASPVVIQVGGDFADFLEFQVNQNGRVRRVIQETR